MIPITVWKKLNTKTGIYEHNHIEDGHVVNKKPIGKFKHQAKLWMSQDWLREYAFLNDNNTIVREPTWQMNFT